MAVAGSILMPVKANRGMPRRAAAGPLGRQLSNSPEAVKTAILKLTNVESIDMHSEGEEIIHGQRAEN
jgi:hypothetical protein